MVVVKPPGKSQGRHSREPSAPLPADDGRPPSVKRGAPKTYLLLLFISVILRSTKILGSVTVLRRQTSWKKQGNNKNKNLSSTTPSCGVFSINSVGVYGFSVNEVQASESVLCFSYCVVSIVIGSHIFEDQINTSYYWW